MTLRCARGVISKEAVMIRFLSLALGLTIGVAASSAEEAAESRVVTGALTCQQKIALPPGARAMVRAEGRFGNNTYFK